MKIMNHNFRRRLLVLAIMTSLPFSAAADDKYDLLQKQVELLQQQLQELQNSLQAYQDEMKVKEVQVEESVTQLKQDVAEAEEWKHSDTLVHLAGYADVGYTSSSGSDGSFSVGRFAPIFHYQYRDIVMLESELEIIVGENGETDVVLEYLTIDYFLNDYVALIAGKFLSPVGQFRQNIHPSWINKLASAPPGFGHDGAAPTSDVGLQARGGFHLGSVFTNYAAYISNGPELNSTADGDEFELEGIVAEGLSNDADGEKVIGGRLGFIPIPSLELGFSVAMGKATVTAVEVGHGEEEVYAEKFITDLQGLVGIRSPGAGDPGDGDPGFDLHDEQARNYDVLGMDFVWTLGGIQVRGEYVKSKVGAATSGLTASSGASWESWYTQASYLLPQTKFEPSVRYTDFNSPHSSQDQRQWAMGVNYLISNSVIAKLTYEFNEGQAGSTADINRWLVQLAYGF
ncbi:MAG: hypothetical protein L3J22_08400 [Xanthomonadales bacterium]|nr:hypothetical protein [Xanthomonadales bacterium]